MSKLFLRHGEVHNQKNIMYGDIPGYRLSEKGITQAVGAGIYIKNNFKIDKIISSPVLRARETSKYVSEYLEVEVEYQIICMNGLELMDGWVQLLMNSQQLKIIQHTFKIL